MYVQQIGILKHKKAQLITKVNCLSRHSEKKKRERMNVILDLLVKQINYLSWSEENWNEFLFT